MDHPTPEQASRLVMLCEDLLEDLKAEEQERQNREWAAEEERCSPWDGQ